MHTLYTFFFILLSFTPIQAQIRGIVTDSQNEPLSFASIYIKNSSLGTATNLKGLYVFDLEPGTYKIVYSYLGYQSIEKVVLLKEHETKTINISLIENPTELGEIAVIANKKDLAKEIMAKVRNNRKQYLHQLESFQCETYSKTTLDRKLIAPSKTDTLQMESQKKLSKRKKEEIEQKKKEVASNRTAFFQKDNLEFTETISTTFFKSPRTYKEKIIATKNYKEQQQHEYNFIFYGSGVDIAPIMHQTESYRILYHPTDPDFNFYKNKIAFPSVCNIPLLSPIAATAPLSYKYDYEGTFTENGHRIFKIKVIPRFPSAALFKGIMFIQDSTFSIKSVDLEINQPVLFSCKEFKVLQNYELIDNQYSLPSRREILYTIKEGKNNYLGGVSVRHKNYIINPTFPKKFFNREVQEYATDAFDKDASFWLQSRPISLKEEETKFITRVDSIKRHYESPAYLQEQDSIFNHIGLSAIFLNGISHRNRENGLTYWIPPVISQFNFFGVGGYRHTLGMSIQKEFPNNQIIHFNGNIDYGFANKDVKGNVGVGYTFLPKKFMRTYVSLGDSYDQINDYESVLGLFSRANYVRSKSYAIEQKMEIINGLFGEITFRFVTKKPIDSLSFKNDIFAELGTPVNFKEYNKSEIKIRLQYRPFQKYYFVHNKKVIIGTNWPEFFLEYRKGIPDILNSEVNYDYLEIGARDYRKIGRWGYSKWFVKAGSFLNDQNLRLFEHKFFRASDAFLFSDPINSSQLLEIENKDATGKITGNLKSLHTSKEFFQVNYIHHFDGIFLNKLPLLRHLKLELAGGANTLLIRDLHFAHAEVFAGIERKFYIFQENTRLGLYAVTADNSLTSAKFRIKIGVSLYDSYNRQWDY